LSDEPLTLDNILHKNVFCKLILNYVKYKDQIMTIESAEISIIGYE